jgi:hypothetical protein
MFTTAVTIGAALIGVALGQTGTPCESYDVASGTGVCNGTNVNIANVLCANGFDANVCKATLASTSGGNSETYFFKVLDCILYSTAVLFFPHPVTLTNDGPHLLTSHTQWPKVAHDSPACLYTV